MNESTNWGFKKSLGWILENTKFCFFSTLDRKNRPMLVLNEQVEGIDCLEIDCDKNGLLVSGVTIFDTSRGECITDSSIDAKAFIESWLKTIGEL